MKTDNRRPNTHAHLYKKFKFPSGKMFWQCMKEGCSHFVHPWQIVGKRAECWYCHKPFIVYQRVKDNAQARPHCLDCNSPHRFGGDARKKRSKAPAQKELDSLLSFFSPVRESKPTEITTETEQDETEQDKETEEIK